MKSTDSENQKTIFSSNLQSRPYQWLSYEYPAEEIMTCLTLENARLAPIGQNRITRKSVARAPGKQVMLE